jgi:hypothetical protein
MEQEPTGARAHGGRGRGFGDGHSQRGDALAGQVAPLRRHTVVAHGRRSVTVDQREGGPRSRRSSASRRAPSPAPAEEEDEEDDNDLGGEDEEGCEKGEEEDDEEGCEHGSDEYSDDSENEGDVCTT